MTRREGDVVVFEATAPESCEHCKQVRELRPYGPNGESICFECGMLDEATTEKMFTKMILGPQDS